MFYKAKLVTIYHVAQVSVGYYYYIDHFVFRCRWQTNVSSACFKWSTCRHETGLEGTKVDEPFERNTSHIPFFPKEKVQWSGVEWSGVEWSGVVEWRSGGDVIYIGTYTFIYIYIYIHIYICIAISICDYVETLAFVNISTESISWGDFRNTSLQRTRQMRARRRRGPAIHA
jgi:hypothetical protein